MKKGQDAYLILLYVVLVFVLLLVHLAHDARMIMLSDVMLRCLRK